MKENDSILALLMAAQNGGGGSGGGGSDLDGKIVIDDTPTVGNLLVANDDGVFVPRTMLPRSWFFTQGENGLWSATIDYFGDVRMLPDMDRGDVIDVMPNSGGEFAGVVASTDVNLTVIGWNVADADAESPTLKVFTLTISNAPAGSPEKAFALSWTSKPLPQEPLVVTLVPDSESSQLSGQWTGTTWAEIQDALETGREIIGVLPGYSRVNMTASIAADQSMIPNAYYVFYVNGTIPIFVNSYLSSNGTYNSQVFQLTPGD